MRFIHRARDFTAEIAENAERKAEKDGEMRFIHRARDLTAENAENAERKAEKDGGNAVYPQIYTDIE